MSLAIREMALEEVDFIIDYFHRATPEHLETLGVDPTRLSTRSGWRERYIGEFSKPVQELSNAPVIWELDGLAVAFSTSDKIVYGEQAHMHLHVVDPQRRSSGIGSACVRATGRALLQCVGAQAPVLRAQRVQRGAEPNATKRRIQVRQDLHDCPRPAQLPPGGDPLGPREMTASKPVAPAAR
jgi:hypothetical protein